MYTISNFVGSLKSAVSSRVEKFIVLDVEGGSAVRPYNIGYIVADRYGTIYRKRSFALTSTIWENISYVLKTGQAVEMCKKNIQEILQSLESPKRSRKYDLISVEHFEQTFFADIQRFKIKRVFAYNVTFDKNSIKRLLPETFNKINVEWCDIISGILVTKLLTKSYVNFCINNGFLTEKRNIMTKAEIVYRYLKKSLDFEEEHTGLADTMIEYEILLAVFSTHKKVETWSPCQAWRKLAKFCEENGISIKG